MVTAAVMSQFHSGNGEDHTSGQDEGRFFSGGFKQPPIHDRLSDNASSSSQTAPLGVPAAASNLTEDDQVRPSVGAGHTAHHFYYLPPTQESAGLTEGRTLDEGRRDESSFEDPRVQTETTLPRENQEQYPTSPMVTPPTRVYQSVNETRTPKSSDIPTQGSPKKSSRGPNKDARPVFSHPVEGVPHVYNDYSQIPYEDETYIRKKTGGVTQPFPEKLHEMLSAVEGTENESIVSWLPHGRAFIVRKPKDFTDIIMPNFFKQTKLTSFQRQLNLYGFRRLTQGVDAGAYYHEMFLRVRPGLCLRMTRQKVKGTGHKQPADVRTEPNFYQMNPLSSTSMPSTQDSTDNIPQHRYFGSVEGTPRQEPSQPHLPVDVPLPFVKGTFEKLPDANAPSSTSQSDSSWRYSQDRLIADAVDAVMDSPMSPGLHGAAHLLQGIASGFMHPSLRIPTSDALPPPASERTSSLEQEALSRPSLDENRRAACFLQPRLSNDESR